MAWSDNTPLSKGGHDAAFVEMSQSLEDLTASYIIKDLHDNELISDEIYSTIMFALLERTGWDVGSVVNDGNTDDNTSEETSSDEPTTEPTTNETPATEGE